MPPKRKRKHPSATSKPPTNTADPSDAERTPYAALFIQAHEADVVRGPQAGVTARSLEVVAGKVGDGLVRWGGGDAGEGARREIDTDVGVRVHDDDDDFGDGEKGEEKLWLDR
jgi:hypothetical protein